MVCEDYYDYNDKPDLPTKPVHPSRYDDLQRRSNVSKMYETFWGSLVVKDILYDDLR